MENLSDARAIALRPELAETTEDTTHTTASKPQKEQPVEQEPAEQADPADTELNNQAQQQATPPPPELSPVAAKVPANIDTSGWAYDAATGTCSANALIIGDSVTAGASGTLQSLLPNAHIDAAVSRQLSTAPDLVAQNNAAGHAGAVTIIALGTNSTIRDESQVQNAINAVGGAPMYFLTVRNPYPMQDINNEILRRYAQNNPNVGIIDWWQATEGHSEYLVDDGTHTTAAGQQVFAQLVRQALCGQ